MRHSQAPEAQPWFWTITAREQPASVVSIETGYMTARKGFWRVGRDVLIIVLITITLGEVGLSIYNSVDPLPSFYRVSFNRFRGKPFAPDWNFRLNSRGFKDLESTRIRPQEQSASSASKIILRLASCIRIQLPDLGGTVSEAKRA